MPVPFYVCIFLTRDLTHVLNSLSVFLLWFVVVDGRDKMSENQNLEESNIQ